MAVINGHALKAAALMPKEEQDAETPHQAAAAAAVAQQERKESEGDSGGTKQPHGASAGRRHGTYACMFCELRVSWLTKRCMNS